MPASLKAIFTFHYVSTYTELSESIKSTDIQFTFHYVSTYTRLSAH